MRRAAILLIALILTESASADFIALPFEQFYKKNIKRYPGYEVKTSVYGKTQVFYYDGYEQTSLPSVDARTFKIDQQAADYGLDNRQVYYQGEVITGADPDSFRLLFSDDSYCRNTYSRDNAHVYRYQYPIAGADPDTFTYVDSLCAYTKDKNHVYTNYSGIERIDDADPATFRLVKDSNVAMDKHAVYRMGRRIDGADPASYRLLDNGYALDKNHAFYNDKPIAGADVKTFRIINLYYAKDRQHVYLKGQLLEIADAATFRTQSDLNACDKHYAYDRNGPKKTDFDHSPCP